MTSSLEIELDPQIKKSALVVINRLVKAWPVAKRGRKPKRSAKHYILALFAKIYSDLSYRKAEPFVGIPRSTLNDFFMKIPNQLLVALVELSARRCAELTKAVCAMIDSTGVSLTSQGFKLMRRREHLKLHVMARYSPGFVWIDRVKITSRRVADIVVGREFLSANSTPTLLLADKGYDSADFYKSAYRNGWRVCMRQRKNCEVLRGLRGRVRREYDDSTYKSLRSRVESIFGGFARRYNSTIEEKLWQTRVSKLLMWRLLHNLRALQALSKTIHHINRTVS